MSVTKSLNSSITFYGLFVAFSNLLSSLSLPSPDLFDFLKIEELFIYSVLPSVSAHFTPFFYFSFYIGNFVKSFIFSGCASFLKT
jgi:hypothetical protein